MKKFTKLFALASSLCLISLFGCATTSNAASKKEAPVNIRPQFNEARLENGMTYIVRENAEPKNRIQLRLVVKAGSAMEDDDQKGVAHFVEHLCFNGTEHFKKSAIVDYFESIGMKFGPEVNAYTTYEQTVYMLEIPADNPEILRTSLLVLRDWACAVSFEQEEIDKERGVILEEWRARTQNLSGRFSAFEEPIYVRGSRFEERPVLGDMDIIKNISRARIVDFYKKWYRPEFMSVIAIGDIKSSVLENAIKETMGTIPAYKSKIRLPEYSVPVPRERTIDILRDKEITVNEIYIVKRKVKKLSIEEQYAWFFFKNIFNQRCHEAAKTLNSVFLNAAIGDFNKTNNTSFYFMQINPKNGRFTEGFESFLDQLGIFIDYGPTSDELENEKQSSILKLTQNFKNVKNQSSAVYTNNMVDYSVAGANIIVSSEAQYQKELKIINEMSKEKIMEMASRLFSDRGTTMLIFCPESSKLPGDAEIMNIWKNHKTAAIKVSSSDSSGDSILMTKPAKKAKVKESRTIKELGAKEYTFENGIKCIFKKTDFETDTISISAISHGGSFQLKEEDIPSSQAVIQYVINSGAGGKTNTQLSNIVNAKRIRFGMGLDNTAAYYQAIANSKNIEQALQLLSIHMREPAFSDDVWTRLMEEYNMKAAAFDSTPSSVYFAEMNRLRYGDSIFVAPVTKDYVSKMDKKKAERIYRELFTNPGDFTFFFIGDFNEKNLVDLCAYYIGTLETDSNHYEEKWIHFPFPKKSKTISVKKGNDKMGNICMRFGMELPEEKDIEKNFKDRIIAYQLADYLNIRLREVIREEKSGTYTIDTSASLAGCPERTFELEVKFTCDPMRQEELRQEVINTVIDLKNGNVSDGIITKLKENYERNTENLLRENYWWESRLIAELFVKCEPLWYTTDYKRIVSEWITKENILEAARKYLDTERVITGFLRPE